MELTQAPPDFVDDLETKLMQAADRLESRRRMARRGIVVAGVLATALAVGSIVPLSGGDGGGLRPALAIDSATETVRIRLLGAEADPDAVREELATVGIAANVEAVPVSPSLEGTWISVELPGDGSVKMVDGDTLVASQPVSSIRLSYGRAANPGETYHVTASALAAGEALHCAELLGRQPEDVAAELADRGLAVNWRQHLPDETLVTDEPPPGVVVHVSPHTHDEVTVFVADPASADQYLEPVDRTGCS